MYMRKFCAVILTFVLMFTLILQVGAETDNTVIDEEVYYNSDLLEDSVAVADTEGISAKAAILIEALTGRVIYSKNENQKLPIASTTKIMTALLTLESGNTDEYFTVDSKAITVEGSSMGLQTGDKVTKCGLACGMLLASGNDAANMAAVKIAGTVPAFAAIMNERAKAIGMKNTNFVTPSGLDAENHYSTCFDMALLGREAISNEDFRYLCSKTIEALEYGNPPYKRWLKNHNRLLREYKGCFGIKTGFTKKSGRCLVTAVEKDGVTLIAVTLNAPNDWQDHKRLYDYGFSQVTMNEIKLDANELSIKISGGQKSSAAVVLEEALYAPITDTQKSQLKQTVLLRPFYYAPIAAGEEVGEIIYTLDGQEIASSVLLAKEGTERRITEIKLTFWEKLKKNISGFFTVVKGMFF